MGRSHPTNSFVGIRFSRKMIKDLFKGEYEASIAPPDFNLVKEVVKKRREEYAEKEERVLKVFQVWLSKYVREKIEEKLKEGHVSWICFGIEISKDGTSGTEVGSIFRGFYEQRDSQKLMFSLSLLVKMKDWIVKDFYALYTLAGYKVFVDEKRFEISWAYIENEAK